jgi:hypothetical protein
MTKEISATAWVILGCFGIFIILINLSLWTAWRKKDTTEGEWLQRFTQGIRSPWSKEDAQLKELSTRINDLKQGSTENLPADKKSNE